MLRIGEFSKVAQVTAKTLRYYDELGLFRPAWVDRHTGYRLYSLQQLPRLNRILVLKELGFSLVEIEQLLQEDQSLDALQRLMRLRQAELECQAQSGHTPKGGPNFEYYEHELDPDNPQDMKLSVYWPA